MIKLIDARVVLTSMLVCFLCGCTGQQNQSLSTNYRDNQNNALQQAEQLVRLANKTDDKQEALNYRLQAIEQLIVAERIEQAEQLFKYELKGKLSTDNTSFKQIVSAQLALAKRDPNAAKQHLSAIWTPLRLPEYLQIKFYNTRSEAYRRSGNLLESVQERIYLARHLKTDEDRKANNDLIWETLSQLTPNTLHSLHKEDSKDELNGWIYFASITKQYDSSPTTKIKSLAAWRLKFPKHPAISFMPQNLADNQQYDQHESVDETTDVEFGSKPRSINSIAINKPKKIAILLPLQGQHAHSAQAVRDGFLAGFYAHKAGVGKPKIQIYDTSAQSNVQGVYKQAVDDGADFVVGPLIKEEVESISQSSSSRTPILALNNIPGGRQDSLFQFSLSPEMEAIAVAEKAWQDGHRNALIITPKSPWGKRMQTTFRESWITMGGKILGVQEIQSQSNLSKEIQQLLSIDASEERAAKLKKLGLKFAFEPRRRQDPNMIFIATNAALARQVKPLLNFYYAANLAAYSGSSIYNGKPLPNLDQDLNGIQFCDMPWILDNSIRSKTTYKEVATSWPREFEQYSRLYALGLDAYKIALQIDQLTVLPDLGVSGMTGMLTIDSQHKVQRKLIWASFKRGVPQINGERS